MSEGQRIKFVKKTDHIYHSYHLFSNGIQLVRLVIDKNKMEYYITDPATGEVLRSGGGTKSYEVLLRKAKRELANFLDIDFEKETRNVKPKDSRSGN